MPNSSERGKETTKTSKLSVNSSLPPESKHGVFLQASPLIHSRGSKSSSYSRPPEARTPQLARSTSGFPEEFWRLSRQTAFHRQSQWTIISIYSADSLSKLCSAFAWSVNTSDVTHEFQFVNYPAAIFFERGRAAIFSTRTKLMQGVWRLIQWAVYALPNTKSTTQQPFTWTWVTSRQWLRTVFIVTPGILKGVSQYGGIAAELT